MSINALMEKYGSIMPIICCCTAYALYNVSDAFIKSLGANLHISQLICSFCLVQLILASYMGWKKDGIRAFVPRRKIMFCRPLLVHLVTFCNVSALTKIELTTFYTVIFTTPLWVALMSSYILKDKIGHKRMIVILTGFAAIVFAMNPFGGNMINIWTFVLLSSAFLSAIDLVILRRIGSSESKWFLVISYTVVGLFLYSPSFVANYVSLPFTTWVVLMLLGALQISAFFILLYGYQNATSASVVAPLHYTQMVWAVLIGYFVFAEVPSSNVLIGAFIIVMSGIYLIFCEKNFQHKEVFRVNVRK